ncbi:glycosyltransferase [Alteromonas sediminis]|uniref:Glycosyltransferase n=1 Tax=Alteromonas sediminis TaxID=2259342 RepID=A0A3N5XWH3_9ALTE|nr:glycosyltransferase [Alteromonas sediminis]RPJ64982.1 glycosyltransferase [Alteromonas sediminis]
MTSSREPLISVVITTCNRPNTLKRAILSVINQTYPNIDLIVVDDANSASAQKTVSALSMKGIPIRYLANQQRMGANYSRNLGIRNARGEFIAGLDDDDEFLPDRLALLMQHYDDSFAFVTSLNIIVSDAAETQNICPREVSLDHMLRRNVLMNQALVEVKRLVSVGLYDESLVSCQDYDMWVRLMAAFGNVLVVQSATQRIYMPENTERISSCSRKKKSGRFQFYRKHKNLMNTTQRLIHLSAIKKYKNPALSKNSIAIDAILKKLDTVGCKAVAAYGKGEFLQELYPYLASRGIELTHVIDSYTQGGTVFGVDILSPSDWVKTNSQYVVIASTEYREEMISTLRQSSQHAHHITII